MTEYTPMPKAEGTEEDHQHPVVKWSADYSWFLVMLQSHFACGRRIWRKTLGDKGLNFVSRIPCWQARACRQGSEQLRSLTGDFPDVLYYMWSCLWFFSELASYCRLGVTGCTNVNKDLGEETEFCYKSVDHAPSVLPDGYIRSMRRSLVLKWS